MEDRVQRDTLNGKKRRALELEREAEEWTTPTPSISSKVRLGKRYQATLPTMRSKESTLDMKNDVDDENDDAFSSLTHQPTSEVRLNTPKSMYSVDGIGDVSRDVLKKYINFATSLCGGYAHGTSHAITANALQLLHQQDHNVYSAACLLYATHTFPSGAPPDDSDNKQLKPKHQEWLTKFYRLLGASTFTKDGIDELRVLSRSSSSLGESNEVQVLHFTLERIDAWLAKCETISTRTCTPAVLHELIHESSKLRCSSLSATREIQLRLEAFELAKSKLFDALVDKSGKSNKKATKIALEPLQALFSKVKSFQVEFAQEMQLEKVLSDASSLQTQILTLLQQDKVSVPAIRDVLARVEATPVDLSNVVEPLKSKMVSAQKWLERARKVMPPTKRQSSRIAVDGAKTKMDLDTVHELVKNAPVDEQSSEMQEMEELLAYADSWAQKVQVALDGEAISIEEMREYLEEGLEMPVVMELTVTLEANIDAREWIDKAKLETQDNCTYEDLQELLEEAGEIRERLSSSWSPLIEEEIRASVDRAETWLREIQELVGSATWSKLLPNEKIPKGKAKLPAKAPLCDLRQLVSSPPAKVDLEMYLTPLNSLVEQGEKLQSSIAQAIENVSVENAYSHATALIEALDVFPCVLVKGDDLRQMVKTAKEWLTRVHAICARLPPTIPTSTSATGRRLTKKQSATLHATPQPTTGEQTNISMEDLCALQSTSLAFQFPEEVTKLAAEWNSVREWQERVRQTLKDQVGGVIEACQTLREDELKVRDQRKAKWERKIAKVEDNPLQLEPQFVEGTAATLQPQVQVEKPDESMGADESESSDVSVDKSSALVDDLIQVIQTLAGGRPGGSDDSKPSSTVNWQPILADIEASLAYIAALDIKAKQEDGIDEPESPREQNQEALNCLIHAKREWIALLSRANSLVSTTEATVLTIVVRTVEWHEDCWNKMTSDVEGSILTKILETGQHFEQECKRIEIDWFPVEFNIWNESLFWPLAVLESQEIARKNWLMDIDKRMTLNELNLRDMEKLVVVGASVGGDDRILWQELKKCKTWLIKIKKAIKLKLFQSKLTMNTIETLVDEGLKFKLHEKTWYFLKEQYDKANKWEKCLKESGLDSGNAKIATLIDLLNEYKNGNYYVDFDMHCDVLISATEQYCICRQPYDGFMIGCELCDDWFHDTCIGISKEKAEKVENYICPSCNIINEFKRIFLLSFKNSNYFFENEEKLNEKNISLALRRIKKEEREVEKLQMTLLEIQRQMLAIVQHIEYLEKINDEIINKTINNNSQQIQYQQKYQPILRTGPFSSHTYLQPMPLKITTPSILQPLLKDNNSQEIEITRFKMEHFKLKQMIHDTEIAIDMSKEKVNIARDIMDTLLMTRDILLPKAKEWWIQIEIILNQFKNEKKNFNFLLFKYWANECENYSKKFNCIELMQKILNLIPWTIELLKLLHGHKKPSYENLKINLNTNLHDIKILLPLRNILIRTDQWKIKTKKNIKKLIDGKKIDLTKIQIYLNEYIKMPLTCNWGIELENLYNQLKNKDSFETLPIINITPPSSPKQQNKKRKIQKNKNEINKKIKMEDE